MRRSQSAAAGLRIEPLAWSLASDSRQWLWTAAIFQILVIEPLIRAAQTIRSDRLGHANPFCRLQFSLIRPSRIGQRLQAQRRGPRNGERHALAGRGVQAVLGRLADNLRAEGVRPDQPGV